jgi:hypothetical protein
VHNKKESKIYECDAPRCSRKGSHGFTRKDHLTEHLRNYHHRSIPKRKKGKGVDEDWQPSEQKAESPDDWQLLEQKAESPDSDEGYSGDYPPSSGALYFSGSTMATYQPQYQSY